MSLSNYPPGMPGPRDACAIGYCHNVDCDMYNEEVEFDAVDELGGVWLTGRSEIRWDEGCPECFGEFHDEKHKESA